MSPVREQQAFDNVSSSPAYRVALALNNMSTSLMKRGDYNHAVNTMVDSLALLKLAFQQTAYFQPPQERQNGTPIATSDPRSVVNDAPSLQEQQVQQDSTEKLHAAEQTLAQSLPRSNARNNVATAASLERSACWPEVYPLDEEDFESIRDAIAIGPSAVALFPVRVRDTHCGLANTACPTAAVQGQEDRKDVERKVGIVLYNHGLAHFLSFLHVQSSCGTSICCCGRNKKCLYGQQQVCTEHWHGLKVASRSFALAHVSHSRWWNARSEQQEILEEESSTYHADDIVPSILLSALALNCLTEILKIQNDITKAVETMEAVKGLCSIVERDFLAFFFSTSTTKMPCVAPAA